ncbi:hypothetical protein [Bacillus sp. J33]|uniref:hypothetical protein n=1 Tax=Bacillus sp. J33 TaxID=935836 RepID=UPI00047AD965|nr:hypothetical protein [Bacillus sp. J33]
MLPIILSILLIISLIFSISVLINKRKKAGITGVKSALTSICFFLIAITNLFAYWFNFMGLINWFITVVLLSLGAYFTKYMPMPER